VNGQASSQAGCEVKANLIHKVLTVIVTEILRPDDSVQVRLHELLDKVNFLKAIERRGLDDVQDADNLFHKSDVRRMNTLHP
jgi:hypothetical protein